LPGEREVKAQACAGGVKLASLGAVEVKLSRRNQRFNKQPPSSRSPTPPHSGVPPAVKAVLTHAQKDKRRRRRRQIARERMLVQATERLLSAVHSESSPSLVVTARIGGGGVPRCAG
jgi:hypothetical protein